MHKNARARYSHQKFPPIIFPPICETEKQYNGYNFMYKDLFNLNYKTYYK